MRDPSIHGARLEVVPLPERNGVIDYARDLLARCESGETTAVTALEEYPNGTFQVTGSGTESRLRTAGMFLAAAMERLRDD